MRFLSFLVTGGIAAFVNIIARYLFNFFVTYEISIVFAFFAGLTTGFLLTRNFVFKATQRAASTQFARFTAVNLVALLQVWLISVGLARVFFPVIGFAWEPETVAHVIGVLSPVASSYFLHKHFSFREA